MAARIPRAVNNINPLHQAQTCRACWVLFVLPWPTPLWPNRDRSPACRKRLPGWHAMSIDPEELHHNLKRQHRPIPQTRKLTENGAATSLVIKLQSFKMYSIGTMSGCSKLTVGMPYRHEDREHCSKCLGTLNQGSRHRISYGSI